MAATVKKLKSATASDVLALVMDGGEVDPKALYLFLRDRSSNVWRTRSTQCHGLATRACRVISVKPRLTKLREQIETLQERKAQIFTELRQAGLSVEEVNEPESAEPAR